MTHTHSACTPPTAIELRQAFAALGLRKVTTETAEEMIRSIIRDLNLDDKFYCVIENDRELVLIGSTLFARDIL